MKSKQLFLPILCSIAIVPFGAYATQPAHPDSTSVHNNDYEAEDGELREAWMEGKLESAFLLNRQLNNFTIDAEVDRNTAILEGSVSSDVDRELAEQISLNVDGIENIRNNLRVDRDIEMNDSEQERNFGDRISDATLTAEVKLKLLANDDTEGLSINVDTVDNEVTLEGDVSSNAEKELSAQIAREVDGVTNVNNRLIVRN